jgi:hypothetical protein
MADMFRIVKRGCGTAAVTITVGYTIAMSLALGDGQGVGLEIPPPISTLGVMAIVCTTIIGAGAWLAERANRHAAEECIRPVVRAEIERALADTMPLFVATVVESLDRRIVPQMHDVAVSAGKQSAVRLRDMVTCDLREIVNDAHRRTLVVGQRMQATAAGEAIGRAALRSIPTGYASTSRED